MVLALLLILGCCCHGILPTTAGCSSTSICSHCRCRGDDEEEENEEEEEEEEETTALTVNPYIFLLQHPASAIGPGKGRGPVGLSLVV